jgi:tRNA pseudouridine38-40 synthase
VSSTTHVAERPKGERVRRIRIVVEYEGTDFVGWQRQANGPSVQAALEEALARMTGERRVVHGAGRTDAGVHALGQVAAFDLERDLPVARLLRGLNALLPPSVAVVRAEEAPPDFDPRRHALGKLYRYRIWNAEARSPLERRTSWHVRRPLDDAAMARAAACLVGEHDFSAFRAADCERKNPVRRIDRLAVVRAGALVTVEVEATAFLKNMVRILVGSLYEVGRGAAPAAWIAEVLASRDRTRAGPTAPPQGLLLVEVRY